MTDVLLQIEYFTNIRRYVKLLHLYAQAVYGAIRALRFGGSKTDSQSILILSTLDSEPTGSILMRCKL